jgi:hypothetical protein
MIEPSYRKPVGVLLILLLIIVWCVIIASMSPIVGGWHIALQTIFYTVAGIAWIMPLRPLLMWMETGKWRE